MRSASPALAVLTAGIASLAACSGATSYPSATVFLDTALQPAVAPFFEFWSGPPAQITPDAAPASAAAAASNATLRIALVADLGCGDCYRIESPSSGLYTIHGGSALGVQYGLAQMYEDFGFRFFHPWQSKVPANLTLPSSQPDLGQLFTPQMSLRGLHLHTQHPIEPYFAFWDSSKPDFSDARRILDWTIKNRGNYVEWYALNSLLGGAPGDAWHVRTAAILQAAHVRGLKVGIGMELFGTSNLQQAFDLLDDNSIPDPTAVMQQRLTLLLSGEPLDTLDMGFGEFTGTDPDYFLTSLNQSYDVLQSVAPGTTMAATVHVGGGPSLTVTYQGQQLLYYFLVQYANPAIASWVHTVMDYDLFEPCGGAYGESSFGDHLDYLEAQLAAGRAPPAYYPESAYWVAFDDSVPTYLPVYVRSRWLDLDALAAQAARNGTPAL